MHETLMRASWIFGLRGGFALLFGLLALLWPGLTMLSLLALFAAFALLSGVASIVGAYRNRPVDDHWWVYLLIGLVGVGAAVLTAIHPALTMMVLVLIIAANALLSGTLDIVTALRLRKSMGNDWLLLASGLAAVVFGVLAFLFPNAGALALVWLISVYAVIYGILLLAFAFKIRDVLKDETVRAERRVSDRRLAGAH